MYAIPLVLKASNKYSSCAEQNIIGTSAFVSLNKSKETPSKS
tara:strand:+ start:116 stop:241 length:126 start_codon:yes stop_codon:yes gene_type:complete